MRRLLSTAALLLASVAATASVSTQMAAPDFTLKSLAGPNVRLGEQRGQVVLINFWASWCGPCKVEMPHLNRLYEKYRASGFTTLAINIDDDPRTGATAAQRWGVRVPVLLDADKRVTKMYDLGNMPSTVLIDRDGKVRFLHRGYRDGVEELYEQQIRQLVKE